MNINERMERAQWDCFWVPDDTRIIDRPELRYISSERPLFYLNQVLRTRANPDQLPELVAEVSAAHAHTLSSWAVFDTFDRAPLERALDAAGYTKGEDSDAMALPVSDFRPPPASAVRVVRVTDKPSLVHSIHVMETTFGLVQEHSDADLDEQLHRCIGADARIVRFVAYDTDDRPVSSASMHIYPALDLIYLWGGTTLPEARGRGAYSALLAARIEHARRRGLGLATIYAITATSAPIVARRGFVRHGYMTRWRQPATAPIAGASAV